MLELKIILLAVFVLTVINTIMIFRLGGAVDILKDCVNSKPKKEESC